MKTIEHLDQSKLSESLILGLADLIVFIKPKTYEVVSLKAKGIELRRLKLEGWVGQKITDFAEPDSVQKLANILKAPVEIGQESEAERDADWKHINLLSPEKHPAPFLVKLFKFKNEVNLRLCARDLGSMAKMQQKLMDTHRSMERDYLRLRHLESRYNLLFENSIEPIVIVDLTTKKITQINPAGAKALLAEDPKKLIGSELYQFFPSEHRDDLETLMTAAQTGGKTKSLTVKSSSANQIFTLTPSLIVQEGGPQLMVRLTTKSMEKGSKENSSIQDWFTDALQKAPFGFIVTDAQGTVLSANDEFVSLTGSFSQAQVLGKPFESWLARAGVDWGVLINNLKQLSKLRNFATELVSQSNTLVEVEISASTLDTNEKRYGFFIRDVHRLSQTGPVASSSMAGSVSQLAQLVGRMPMKDIVGETSDMIEKMCIQSALQLTQNNRASTAEMLGLSRQSLYIKLHRYGIADSNDKPS